MRIGIFLNQYFHRPGESVHQEILEQTLLLEELGFDFVALGERHLYPAGIQEPLTTLAWLAGKSTRIRLASAGFILPLYHPVMLAEMMANLDVICGGRVIFGVVLGYRPEEFALFGVPYTQRAGRMEEALQIIGRLWAGETVTFAGRYYHLTDASISPVPLQRPRPPVWVGARVPEALVRAARYADGWMTSFNESPAELEEKIPLYRAAAARTGQMAEVVVMRDGFVADSAEQARRIIEGPLLGLYQEYRVWKRTSPDAEKYAELSFDKLLPNLLVGSPDEVIAGIRRYEAMGADAIALRCQYRGLSQGDTLRCLRLLGETVLPAFRDTSPAGPSAVPT
jgi:alkanesulfonate monooxygenase SsuD/methylene tetrahydromethanopterin reductase-like flavin-dependent oxidoreductase (luciferase family)